MRELRVAAEREVIREFLASLGFQVDAYGLKKFAGSLAGITKLSSTAGATLAGVAVAAEAMVQTFAHGMEKMYYASRRTKASVENIQALEFAATKVGVSGDAAREALESMSRAMRMNPGLAGLLKSLGVRPAGKGRDQLDLMLDLVQQLSKVPHFVGAQWAQMFGMDEQTFLMMKENLPKMREAIALRKELNKVAGVDAEAAAAASREYMNTLRELWTKVEVIFDGLAVRMLPFFREFTGVLNSALSDLMQFLQGVEGKGGKSTLELQLGGVLAAIQAIDKEFTVGEHLKAFFWAAGEEAKLLGKVIFKIGESLLALKRGEYKIAGSKAWEAVKAFAAGPEEGEDERDKILGINRNSWGRNMAKVPITNAGASTAAASGGGGPGALFARLENQFGLPTGLLASMYQQESGSGRNLVGPMTRSGERALGPFQFMKAAASRFGVTDPMDLVQSATGASKYMRANLDMFGGDLPKALAGYNWGEGNVQRRGLGAAPLETQNYISGITGRMGGAGVAMNQTNNFNIHGADAQSIASATGNYLDRANATLLRNTKGAIDN